MAAIGEPVPERAGPLDYDEAEWRFEVRQASYAGRGAREAATDHAHCERCFRHAHLRFAARSYAVIHKVYGGNEAQLSFAWHRSRDHSHPAHDKQGIKSGSAAFVETYSPLPEIRDAMLATICRRSQSPAALPTRGQKDGRWPREAPLGSAWYQAGEVKRERHAPIDLVAAMRAPH